MRFDFILSEIGIGLRRNLTMTLSVVLVTAVSLLMLGVGFLAQEQVSTMKDYWYDRVQVSIFLCSEDSTATSCAEGAVTDAQKAAILADLQSSDLQPYVEDVYFESQDEAYDRFQEQYGDTVLAQNVTADQMPESYRVKLKDPEEYEAVSEEFRDRSGVDSVQDQNRVLDRLFSLLNGLKWCAWGVAGLTLFSSVLLVATTIRLNAFTRRRETAIMRLVGASNVVIQLPFVLESMVAAVAGAVIASVILGVFTKVAVQGWLAGSMTFIANWVTLGDALLVMPWMFLVGMLIAGVSSFLSLRRYLTV